MSKKETNLNLNPEQEEAFEVLKGIENVFLTGAAGTGKSFLIRRFLKDKNLAQYPVVASTAAAAILVGGRTFHSFFGVGIIEGGYQATLSRAVKNKRLAKRLKETYCVVIDEISMLSGTHLKLAEEICRKILKKERPWGGLKIVAVGDFAQLPPVNPHGQRREWAFLDEVWSRSHFQHQILTNVMRSKDEDFLRVLSEIREGKISSNVQRFLESRVTESDPEFDGTRLFARRDQVESYNLGRLAEIDSDVESFQTSFTGSEADIEKFKKNIPIPEILKIKTGALIMFRQNDLDQKWVNGTLGHVSEISEDELWVELMDGGEVLVKKADFTMLDADGNPVAKANNFPIQLAWAVTIHKAQGTTIDRMRVDLRGLWEPGQAYVALSRSRKPQDLYLDAWEGKSIITDKEVMDFYKNISNESY